MYLVAFFYSFFSSLNIQQNHNFFFSPQRFVKGKVGGGRGARGRDQGRGRGGACGRASERAQYKPQPRRLLAMMMSVTASNTTWMFPVSVAQVM